MYDALIIVNINLKNLSLMLKALKRDRPYKCTMYF